MKISEKQTLQFIIYLKNYCVMLADESMKSSEDEKNIEKMYFLSKCSEINKFIDQIINQQSEILKEVE